MTARRDRPRNAFLVELNVLGIPGTGGDGFADGFPVAVLAGLIETRPESTVARRGRLNGFWGR
jgi:hypothetical protein